MLAAFILHGTSIPAPAGHYGTRQWLVPSGIVYPPSWLRRMKEFSPVTRT